MGYGDGYYYGQGKFICNTANLLQGDVIRVRSLTDTSKVWNKTVTSTDTPIVFDVPGKDYYRICLVQDIEGTPTEIGGTNYPIHYGYVQYVDVLDKTTLGGIQGILNSHTENYALNIGDEVTITVNGGTETMIVSAINLYNSHEVRFVCKNSTNDSISGYGIPTGYKWTGAPMQTYLNSFYSTIDERDRQYIKKETRNAQYYNGGWVNETYECYIYVPNVVEVNGGGDSLGRLQYPIFTTQANRIKTKKLGSAINWGLSDFGHVSGTYDYEHAVNTAGGISTYVADPYSAVPCFTLQADS